MSQVLILAGDTVSVRSMIMSLEVEGFKASRVSNGDELINKFAVLSPVGVLCDLAAPWAGLLPLLKRLRAHGAGKVFRIVLFGDRPPQASDATLLSLSLSEEDVFPEPVDMPSLIRRLRDTTRSGKAADAPRSILGFPRTSPLQEYPLARVLSTVANAKGNGQLEVESQQGLIEAWFKDGALVATHVPTGPLSLGVFLVTQAKLEENQRLSLARVGSVSLEAYLSRGLLQPYEVPELAKAHAESVLGAALAETSGLWRWSDHVSPRSNVAFPLGLNLHRLILDRAKKTAPLSLPDDMLGISPALEPKQREKIQAWGLLPLELRATNQLDGTRTLAAIVEALSGGSLDKQTELNGIFMALKAMGIIALAEEPQDEVVDWDARKKELEAELERMSKADPFGVLGVEPRTSIPDTRTRFFNLSKQYHPDKAFGAPPEVKEVMEAIFKKVQEAYEMAGDPKKRDEFLRQKEEGEGLDARAAVQAEISFTQGELFLKNRHFAKAKELFQQAHTLNPHAVEYRIHLAWTTFLDDPAHYLEATKQLNEIVKANPNLDKAYYFIGCIMKARNEMSQAEGAFKRAVSANPNNVEAQRELRLIDMRRGQPATPAKPAPKAPEPAKPAEPKKGLFSFFKKS